MGVFSSVALKIGISAFSLSTQAQKSVKRSLICMVLSCIVQFLVSSSFTTFRVGYRTESSSPWYRCTCHSDFRARGATDEGMEEGGGLAGLPFGSIDGPLRRSLPDFFSAALPDQFPVPNGEYENLRPLW